MSTPDISYFGLMLCSLLLIIPLGVSLIFKLGILAGSCISIGRMVVQLILIGVFLKYLFALNHPAVNIFWLLVMIGVATFNISRDVRLDLRIFIIPTFVAFTIATISVLFYITAFVLNLSSITDARYFVVIGGMLLGNSLRGNIIGIDKFYTTIRRNENRYLHNLAQGASLNEALLPYLKESLVSALQPTIATMATMGIVFLPGMMTGQILAGLSPLLAIKYQVVIMIAIFASTAIAINLTILFTSRTCFSGYGLLRKGLFK